MTLRFPTFNLTPAETASLETTVVDLLAEGARLLHRPGPMLGRHDYAAALRLVRDATAYSADLLALAAEEEGETDDDDDDDDDDDEDEDEEENEEGEAEEGDEKKKKKKATKESAYAASCALLKGDALRGLGRFADAADAYGEAAATYDVEKIPSVGPSSLSSFSRRDVGDDDSDSSDEEAEPHIDRAAAGLAARHLADLEGRRFFPSSPRRRRRRAGGLWNAHDVAGALHRADENEEEAGRRDGGEVMEALRVGSSGRRAEYWDPEPALVLRAVMRHQPILTLVDQPAVRAAAGAVPAVVVGVAAASGRRVHGPKRAMTSIVTAASSTTTTTRPSTSGGGGGSWLPSGNPRVAATTAAPRGQEQPPRPLRRRKSTSQDLKALLQAQTGDRHGSSSR